MKLLFLVLYVNAVSSVIPSIKKSPRLNNELSLRALDKVTANVNKSINNARYILNPILSNSKYPNSLSDHINDFRDLLNINLGHATTSFLSSHDTNSPRKLLKIWKDLLISDLQNFTSNLLLTNSDYISNQIEHVKFLDQESIKLQKLINTRLFPGLNFKAEIFSLSVFKKRSIFPLVSKIVLDIVASIVTILGSWIIMGLYGLAWLLGTVAHFFW